MSLVNHHQIIIFSFFVWTLINPYMMRKKYDYGYVIIRTCWYHLQGKVLYASLDLEFHPSNHRSIPLPPVDHHGASSSLMCFMSTCPVHKLGNWWKRLKDLWEEREQNLGFILKTRFENKIALGKRNCSSAKEIALVGQKNWWRRLHDS